jgi:hypothetical protein
MYMSDLRRINDPVLSSLKMEGIRLFYLFIFFCRRPVRHDENDTAMTPLRHTDLHGAGQRGDKM